MVCLIWTCVCETCTGGHSPKKPNGEIVFGGWKCMCACHGMSGQEKEDYIKLKKDWEKKHER